MPCGSQGLVCSAWCKTFSRNNLKHFEITKRARRLSGSRAMYERKEEDERWSKI